MSAAERACCTCGEEGVAGNFTESLMDGSVGTHSLSREALRGKVE